MPARLKSLELHGYKTFASRTLFEFSERITAVVGPNGSGKSNIADSLRWVLGEQSYALLRGKKTEDMIFSGSEHRPRAGMASATITFDNSDGWLPIDFSEVSVTRRAYRDGQNEYLINRQRVRLKDVTELLAQSGLAERTYTIIGQGLVDAALALKAEERRRLFEEAAGTGLHRARREEALRRLETTRRNLERVQDILAELQPRLKSLERQARRAQEYEQVKADLQLMLREWYGFHWHRAQQELTESREAVRMQELALQKARQTQQALDGKLSDVRDRLQSLRASLNAWHRQSAQLHNRREALSRELAVAEERMRSLQSQLANGAAEQARLEEELGMQAEQVQAAAQEAAVLEADLAEAYAQAEAARRALAARQAERTSAEKNLQSARQALSGLNARQGQLQARLGERKAQVERSRQAFEAADRAVSGAENEVKTAEAQLSAALEVQHQAEAALKTAEEALHQHRQRLAAAEAARKTTLEAQAVASAEAARFQAQMDVLEQAETALSGYASGARLVLQSARQSELEGVRGALTSFLEVPAEYEAAIAAALGEFLDAVLVDGDAMPALDRLCGAGLRGALLPLSSIKTSSPWEGEFTSVEGVIDLAARLVKAPPELCPVVDLLLGQAVVVRDQAAAHRLLAFANGSTGLRVVTLRGEVFLPAGPILSGGTASSEAGHSVLGRQRQRRELQSALSAAHQRLDELRASLRKQESELDMLQGDGSQLSKSQNQARKEAEQASLAVNAARLDVEQSMRLAKWQAEQRMRLQSEIQLGEAEAERLTTDLDRLDHEIQLSRDTLRQLSTVLASLGLDDFQAQVAHWNTQAAVAERAMADGRNRLRERQAAYERIQRSSAGLQSRLVEMQHTLQTLEADKAVQRQKESEVGAEIEALRASIDPGENDLDVLEKQQAEQQTAEAAARQALSLAEHRHAQSRILLARRQETLDSLRRRVEDDFGLVAFEYTQDVSGPTPLPLEGMVEQLPFVHQLSPDVEEGIKRQRTQLRRMGAINPEAQAEYQEVRDRFRFLTEQVADLEGAEEDVRQVIAELDALMHREFRRTFEAVAIEFKEIFSRLFGGGAARLVLTDPDNLTDTGIDIEARLPGRRTQGLSLLSGGERSLTAAALVFSLLKVSPTPFCVLDEVDAMLDEANVGRYRELLRELSQNTQFVVVTHNRNTVQAADVIYGVTMGRDSSSQVLSLKLDEVSRVV